MHTFTNECADLLIFQVKLYVHARLIIFLPIKEYIHFLYLVNVYINIFNNSRRFGNIGDYGKQNHVTVKEFHWSTVSIAKNRKNDKIQRMVKKSIIQLLLENCCKY